MPLFVCDKTENLETASFSFNTSTSKNLVSIDTSLIANREKRKLYRPHFKLSFSPVSPAKNNGWIVDLDTSFGRLKPNPLANRKLNFKSLACNLLTIILYTCCMINTQFQWANCAIVGTAQILLGNPPMNQRTPFQWLSLKRAKPIEHLLLIACVTLCNVMEVRGQSQNYPAYRTLLGIELSKEKIPSGARISGVGPGSPAANVGLQVGDTLTFVDGYSVTSADQAFELMYMHPPLDPSRIKIQIERSGKSLTMEVKPDGFLRLKALNPKQVFFIPGVDTGSPFEPKTPITTLDSMNVLTRVLVDPESGTVEFIGTYDPAYKTGPVDYHQLLEDAVLYPEPGFSLDADRASWDRLDELSRRMTGSVFELPDDQRTVVVESLFERWTKLILSHPLLEIDRQLFLDKLATEIGMTKSQLVDLYNYHNLGVKSWPVPASILEGQVKVLEYVGKVQGAKAYRIYAQGASESLMNAAEALGKADQAKQLLAEPELAGKSDAERQVILRAFVLSQIALSLEMADEQKANELFLRSRQGKYPVEIFDAWLQGGTRIENWDNWKYARIRVFQDFPLSNELLEAAYGLAPAQSLLRFEGLAGDTALGRILYEADYTLKTIDMGQMVYHTIPSHQTFQKIAHKNGGAKIKFNLLFWLEPKESSLTISPDRREVGFSTPQIILKTKTQPRQKDGAATDETALADIERFSEIYRKQINENYDVYAREYPPLHRLREVTKIIALARWMNEQKIKLTPERPATENAGQSTGSQAWKPPPRVNGVYLIYTQIEEITKPNNKVCLQVSTPTYSHGGVSFRTDNKWVAILPRPTTYELADDALTTSATLGEAAVQAALSNDLVKARDLAEQSAQAMQGEINIRRLPGNVAIPERPVPGIATPQTARLIKEAARIVQSLDVDTSSGTPQSITPTQRTMLTNLSSELNKVVSGSAVSPEFQIKLRPSYDSQAAAVEEKEATFCEEFRTATAKELNPEQKKFYETQLAEVRLDMETLSQLMSDASILHQQGPASFQNWEAQVAAKYRSAQDRLLEALTLMLIDSPPETRRKLFEELYKTLSDTMMNAIVSRKSMTTGEQTAAVDRKIFRLLELQLRFQLIFGTAAHIQNQLGKISYDLNHWAAADRTEFEKLKTRLLQFIEILVNEPSLIVKIDGKVAKNDALFRWLSPHTSVVTGFDFLCDIVAQRRTWLTISDDLKRSKSQPGLAFTRLHQRAVLIHAQILCLEGGEVADTPRPTFDVSPEPLTTPFDVTQAAECQKEWAKYLYQPVEVNNTLDMTFRLIPPGHFMMGADEDAKSVLKQFAYLRPEMIERQYPLHKVHITKPIYMGAHEVTLGQFLTFYHESKYKLECERDGKESLGWKDGEERRKTFRPWQWGFADQTFDHPVVLVTWNDAVAFCEWLSRKEGKTYRLPTEAEWEYACKAGTTTRFYFGNAPEDMIHFGNGPDRTLREKYKPVWKEKPNLQFPTLQGSDGYALSAPVGSFQPNAFGLFDMTGNVWEWCGDWYSQYDAKSPNIDPQGPSVGTQRVLRGGSWGYEPSRARSCDRGKAEPNHRQMGLGFRVVLVP
jgi:formylglycine-generating enzyme required for sulfatase activity